MTYGDFKDLPRRTTSDKVLHDDAFNITKYPKYDGCESGINSVVYNFCLMKILLHVQLKQQQKPLVVLLKVKLCSNNNYQKNHTSQLLENVTNIKYIHRLRTTLTVLI